MEKLEMRKNWAYGKLFTFCGLDGCGKTTMLNKLKKYLQRENEILMTKQPTNAVRESAIFRAYMDSPDHYDYDYRSLSLLAASDRVQHVNGVVVPALERGQIVLSDRYFYSCLANLRARGYKKDQWIYEVAQFVVKPDIAFFFDVPVDTAVARVRSREAERDRYIDLTLQYKLRDEYLQICKANNGILVPTDIPEEESYQIVKNAVDEVMKHGNK